MVPKIPNSCIPSCNLLPLIVARPRDLFLMNMAEVLGCHLKIRLRRCEFRLAHFPWLFSFACSD